MSTRGPVPGGTPGAAGGQGSTSPGSAGTSAARPEIRRLLLMQLKWMGDVLLTTPALRAVRRAFPGARIDYVTGVEGAAVLAGNPHVDRVIVWRRGVRGGFAAWLEVARGRYDAVVDFRSTPRDALNVLGSRARVRVGVRGRGPRKLAYTHLFPKETGAVYMPRQKLELLRPLGIEPAGVTDLDLELVVPATDRGWAQALLERHGLAGGAPIVAVSAVTRVHYKQWGAERWAAVADRVAERGARVLLTSGPGELEQARAVAERMRAPAVYDYGPTTLLQLAALYERCALWIGNDGGAKHIAVAVGTPTVTAFRHRESAIWTDGRPGRSDRAIERAPVLPCGYPHCGDCPHLSCLEQLRVEEVAALVGGALDEATGARPGDAATGA